MKNTSTQKPVRDCSQQQDSSRQKAETTHMPPADDQAVVCPHNEIL